MGSKYGSWAVPTGLLGHDSVCYLAGAGEDITFDVALQQEMGCQVHVFDPTPRAVAHFNQLEASVNNNTPFATPTGHKYQIPHPDRFSINFHAIGLWDKADTLKFYAPKNEAHVSFSALNLQKTTDYFEAKVDSVKNLMSKLGHLKVNLLKLDIEGAEYRVIESVLNDGLDVDIICIEFDESHTPLDRHFHKRITRSLRILQNAGYKIFDIDPDFNIALIGPNAYKLLIPINR
jgi:FkbM family methyltransferase